MCQHTPPAPNSTTPGPPSIATLTATLDLPTSNPTCLRALTLARAALAPAIFNHSLRVYLYATWLAQRPSPAHPAPPHPTHERTLLFLASLFHDMGTAPQHDADPARFEVCGADAAAAFLRAETLPQTETHDADAGDGLAVTDDDIQQVWLAIALHTSAGIAERTSRLVWLVRSAVRLDFAAQVRVEMGAGEVQREIEGVLARGGVERVLANAVVWQALRRPGKAVANSWAASLVKAHLEDPRWDRDNPAF